MSKQKIFGKLLTYVPIRRGNWVIKASVYHDKNVMLICNNCATAEFYVRHFTSQLEAVEFMEYLIVKDSLR